MCTQASSSLCKHDRHLLIRLVFIHGLHVIVCDVCHRYQGVYRTGERSWEARLEEERQEKAAAARTSREQEVQAEKAAAVAAAEPPTDGTAKQPAVADEDAATPSRQQPSNPMEVSPSQNLPAGATRHQGQLPSVSSLAVATAAVSHTNAGNMGVFEDATAQPSSAGSSTHEGPVRGISEAGGFVAAPAMPTANLRAQESGPTPKARNLALDL